MLFSSGKKKTTPLKGSKQVFFPDGQRGKVVVRNAGARRLLPLAFDKKEISLQMSFMI